MAPNSALAELRRCSLKKLLGGNESNSTRFMGSGDPVFKSTLNASAPKVPSPKKQKRKKVAKEKKIIQVDLEDTPTLEGKLDISVLAKDFPYPEFMDRELMTPALLEQLWADDDGLEEKFPWVGRVLLKSTMLLRYSEPVISSGVRAIREVKDLEERIILLEKKEAGLRKGQTSRD